MKRTDTQQVDTGEIAAALERLADELEVIRQVLDEIRHEMQWANRNGGDNDHGVPTERRITSMPLDPTAKDWAKRLNRYSAADLPADDRELAPRRPGHLF